MNPDNREILLDELQKAVGEGKLPEDVSKAVRVDKRGVYVDGDFSGVLVTGNENIITIASPSEITNAETSLDLSLNEYLERLEKASRESGKYMLDEPYLGLYSYRLEDASYFFGRERATQELLGLLEKYQLIWLHGRSGTGKTSLIRAGIMPALFNGGAIPIYVRSADESPTLALKRNILKHCWTDDLDLGKDTLLQFLTKVIKHYGNKPVIIFFDQFEEFFTQISQDVRETFGKELRDCLDDTSLNVKLVFSMRSDYFGETITLRQRLSDIRFNEYALHPLIFEEALDAILRPAKIHNITFEDGLAEKVLSDLETAEISPPQLQLVCQKLYRDAAKGTQRISFSAYNTLGGAKKILQQYLVHTLQDRSQISPNQQQAARYLLSSLVSPEGRREAKFLSALQTDSRFQSWALAWYAKEKGIGSLELKELRQYAIHDYLEKIEKFVSLKGEKLATLLDELSEPITNAYVRSITSAFVNAVVNTFRNLRLLIVSEKNGEPVLELAHDYLADEIIEWLDENDVEAKRIRRMLDQKHYDYKTYQLLLETKELEIVANQLENPSLKLSNDDKRLLLYSSISHGQGALWAEVAGENSILWLREACLDEQNIPKVRRGAARNLGLMEDEQVFQQLKHLTSQSVDAAKKNAYGLLAEYLHNSPKKFSLPKNMQIPVFFLLARLQITSGSNERKFMKRVAMATTLMSVIVFSGAYVAFQNLLSVSPGPIYSIVAFFVFLILAQFLGYAFAEGITSLKLIVQNKHKILQLFSLVGFGIILGAPFFFVLTMSGATWFSGGLIGLGLSLLSTKKTLSLQTLNLGLSALISLIPTGLILLGLYTTNFTNALAAIIVAGFIMAYLSFASIVIQEREEGQRIPAGK